MEKGYVKLTGFEGSHTVTKGDVSFARLIIESSYILDNWNDPHVYMQMKGPDGQVMVCTSSWLHWAREVTCMVNCFYCHVRPENRSSKPLKPEIPDQPDRSLYIFI